MNTTVIKETGLFKPRKEPVSERTPIGIAPSFDKPDPATNSRADANYFGQLLSWEIAGKHTFNMQFNVQYIADALNETFSSVVADSIVGSSLHHSKMSLWTGKSKYTFDLKEGVIDKTWFIEQARELVNAGELVGEY